MDTRPGAYTHSRHLPPIELRAEGFENPLAPDFVRQPTPLTDIGLVDRTKLMKLVRGTLTSAYKWPSDMDDEHHLQWPRRKYTHRPDATVNPYEFRNLPLNKMYWPRMFHNWAHRVTEPPPVPSDDVMYYTTQAQGAIDALSRAVQIAKMLTRNCDISQASRESRVNELFDEYSQTIEGFRQLPSEFHFINLEKHAAATIDEFLASGGELGRIAAVSTVATATRYLRQSTHKQLSLSAA